MPGPPSKSAKWTDELGAEFSSLYTEVAAKPDCIASGGKQLKSKGWSEILVRLAGKGNLKTTTQLQSRWKRLKEDYTDYKWLMLKFSGDGLVGLSNEAWAELDENPRNLPMSRFRDRPFRHYDIISDIVGDTMASGESIGGVPSSCTTPALLQLTEDETIEAQREVPIESSSDSMTLIAAQKRKKLINECMKTKRQRKEEENSANLDLKRKNSDTLA
ncbi:hypothetical protein LEN26_002973 [Aphanomyces euteiches]|nr:hypothetical protein AeMF1_004877 [Aphanomyces euteiches]KAH9158441.1 hypothetical protein LEN26_002973 [Aphanomyces euteiches]KAH9186270.1 hypothetical protein AeNC1_011755 [Aphanomyces euteiches]